MADCTSDWRNVTLATFNQTLLSNPSLCTSCSCPLKIEGVQLAMMQYRPSLAGNVLFVAVFGLLLLLQLVLGLRYRARGFMLAMVCGLLLEVLGYVGRILLSYHMFDFSYFLMYLICLTIGPAFLSAAIYLTLSRLIVIYGPEWARFRPLVYTYIFIACDLVALVLQAAGGAVASIATSQSAAQKAGIDVMVAGVAWQVASLALFGLLSLDYWLRVMNRRSKEQGLNPAFEALRARPAFQPRLMVAFFFAGLFIFARSVFRCAELSGGFNGPLANEEVTFMVLEGTMMILTCMLLTAFHPGLIIGADAWARTGGKTGRKYEEARDQSLSP